MPYISSYDNSNLQLLYIYTYTYICMYMYMYIHIYIYVGWLLPLWGVVIGCILAVIIVVACCCYLPYILSTAIYIYIYTYIRHMFFPSAIQ